MSAPCSWEEIEEDRYQYEEGLGLCELDRTQPPNDTQHSLAMERVRISRELRAPHYFALRLFEAMPE